MKRLLVLMMALAMLTGCNISGVVTDSEGNGLEGVAVELSGDASLTVTTDVDGNYTFEDVDRGSYTVTPSLDGYEFDPDSRDLSISMKDAGSVDFTAMLLPRTVSGFIAGPDGAGLDGVTVELSGDATYSAVTAAGNFVFNEVVQGDYTLRSVIDNHIVEPLSLEVSVDKIDITGLIFSIRPMPSVSGVIAGVSGAGITVELRGETIRNVTTEADGSYLFKYVAAGDYTVTPYCPGYLFEPSIADITVAQDDVTADFVSTMAPRTVSGSVVDENGQPLDGAVVELSGPESKITTTGNGQFTFNEVRQGQYTVSVTLAGYTVTPPTQTITVGMQDVSGLQFNARALPAIDGVVWDIKLNKPSSGITVKLRGDVEREAETGADGRYRFDHLESGTYTVSLVQSGFGFGVEPQQFRDGVVAVFQNDVKLDFEVWQLPNIRGYVRQSDNHDPISYCRLELIKDGQTIKVKRTNNLGSYLFSDVEPGIYSIVATHSTYFLDKAFPAEDGLVTVYQDNIEQHFDMLPKPDVYGTILNARDNQPLKGVDLELRGDQVYSARTYMNGKYKFENVQRGKEYELVILLDGYELPQEPILISVGDDDVESSHSLWPVVSVYGNVYESIPDGWKQLPGVTVELRGEQVYRTVSDESGHYVFNNVPRDQVYTLLCYADGYEIRTIYKIGVFNDDIKKNLALWPIPDVYGTVKDTNISTNVPMVGVELELRGDQVYRTVTDDAGRYVFKDVRGQQEYDLLVTAPGYEVPELPYKVKVSDYDEEFNVRLHQLPDVHGFVTDTLNDVPLSGIELELRGDQVYRTVTDDAGRYMFENVRRQQEYDLIVAALGYDVPALPYKVRVFGSDKQFDLPLSPLPDVHGYVTDAHRGSPLAGKEMELRHEDHVYRTITEASGLYVFKDVARNRMYELVIHADGYDLPGPFEVYVGDLDEEESFALLPLYEVSGMVWLGNTTNGLENVTVNLNGSTNKTVKTDQNGDFVFDDVRNAPHSVKARAIGYEITPDQIDIFVHERNSEGIIFRAEPIADAVGVVYGSIKDPSGQPVAGIDMLLDDGQGATKSAVSGSDGSYEINGLPEGMYSIKPINDTYCFEPVMTKVKVGASPVRFDLIATMEPNIIEGQILTASEQPVGGVTVALNGPQQMVTSTDADGFYEFKFSTDGEYTIEPKLAGVTVEPVNRKVYVNNSVVGSLDFEVESLPQISGNIRNFVYDHNIYGVQVELQGDVTYTTTTDENGNYSFENVENGNYTVKPDDGWHNFEPEQRQIELNDQNFWSADFLAVWATSTGVAQGTVTDSDGSGLADVEIKITNEATNETVITSSDSNGFYIVDDLPVCEYVIAVKKDGYTFDPSKKCEFVYDGVTIDFVAIDESPDVSGVIVDDVGNAMTSLKVELRGGGETLIAYTDQSGRYVFDSVAPGNYQVMPRIERWRFDHPSIDIEVMLDDIEDVDFVGTEADQGILVFGSIILHDTLPTAVKGRIKCIGETSQFNVEVDDWGSFVLRHVPVGVYKLIADVGVPSMLPFGVKRTVFEVVLYEDRQEIQLDVLDRENPIICEIDGQGQISDSSGSIVSDSNGNLESDGYVGLKDYKITAIPAPGWLFSHWEGAYEGTDPTCILDIFVSGTVKAVFKPQPDEYQITIDGNSISRFPSGSLGFWNQASFYVEHNNVGKLIASPPNASVQYDFTAPGRYEVTMLQMQMPILNKVVSNTHKFVVGEIEPQYLYELSIGENYTVIRSGDLGVELEWVVEQDGVVVESRSADDELSYQYKGSSGSTYRVWLEGSIGGESTRVSNILTYSVGTKDYLYSLVLDEMHNVYRTSAPEYEVYAFAKAEGVDDLIWVGSCYDKLILDPVYDKYSGEIRIWLAKSADSEPLSNVLVVNRD